MVDVPRPVFCFTSRSRNRRSSVSLIIGNTSQGREFPVAASPSNCVHQDRTTSSASAADYRRKSVMTAALQEGPNYALSHAGARPARAAEGATRQRARDRAQRVISGSRLRIALIRTATTHTFVACHFFIETDVVITCC
jgi:hypothetical protein